MQVQVELEVADVDALCDLREWLQENQAVRQYARLRWVDTAGTGATGVGLDAVQLTVGDGFSLLQLAVAIGRWRDSRDPAPTVVVSRTNPDGIAVGISSSDPAVLREVIYKLEAD